MLRTCPSRAIVLSVLLLASTLAPLGLVHAQSSGGSENTEGLFAQLRELQAKLNALVEEEASVPECAFTRALFQGVSGEDVSCLQRMLQTTGDFSYPEITDYFGPVTEAAVQRYQTRMDVVSSGTPDTTGFGVVGPKTRESFAQIHREDPVTATEEEEIEEEAVEEEETTTLPMPSAPSRFSITGSGSQVRLSWNIVENAVDYAVERKEGDDFETIATTEETSYVDSGLSSSGTYTYRILARNDAGSAASGELRAYTSSGGGGDGTAPTVSSSNASSTPENTTFAHALTANESVTWSIVGGADQARFELSDSTLRWDGNGTKDYETPNDADTNNTYIVTVRATDTAGNTSDQTITVSVTDVSEWVPTDGASLLAWYDPSDFDTLFQERTGASATTPAGVGDPVGTMLDKSGNAFHLTADSDAGRPILRQSGNLYYIEFDGTADDMTGAAPTSALQDIFDDENYTFGFAASGTVPVSSDEVVFSAVFNGSTYIAIRDDRLILRHSSYFGTSGTQFDWTTSRVAVVKGDGTLHSGRVDGTTVFSDVDFVGSPAGSFASVGSRGSGLFFAMNLYQLITYSTELTGTDLDNLENYLAEKSGTTL